MRADKKLRRPLPVPPTEINRDKLRLQTLIGQGNFAKVCDLQGICTQRVSRVNRKQDWNKKRELAFLHICLNA